MEMEADGASAASSMEDDDWVDDEVDEDYDGEEEFYVLGTEGPRRLPKWWKHPDYDVEFLDFLAPRGSVDSGPPPRPFSWKATSWRSAEAWLRTYDGVQTMYHLVGKDLLELLYKLRKEGYEQDSVVVPDDVPQTSTMRLAARARRPPPAGHAAQHRCLPHRARAAGPPSEAGTTRDPLEGVPTEALINELLERRSVISAPLGSADAPPRRRRRATKAAARAAAAASDT